MFAKVTSLLALVVSLGGGALAVGAIPAPNGTVNACFSTRSGAVRVVDSKKRKCRKGERSLAWSQRGPAGAPGERGGAGPKGDGGTPGTNGTDGSDGSPDTPAAVLGKLATVDGAGSGLDADLVRGQSPAATVSRNVSAAENGGAATFQNAIDLLDVGTIQYDCNSETNVDLRFTSTASTGPGTVHVTVDTGGANALQSSDEGNGTATTEFNVSSFTAANPEFQIWHIVQQNAQAWTVFVEINPDGTTACHFRSHAIGTVF